MDQESRETRITQIGKGGQGVQTESTQKRGYEEAKRLAYDFQKPVFEFVRKTAEGYPEVTLQKLNLNFHAHDDQWDPGINLQVTGPELAVKAFLSHVALVLNVTSFAAHQLLDKGSGGTFDASVKWFYAILDNPNPNFTMAQADRSFVKAWLKEYNSAPFSGTGSTESVDDRLIALAARTVADHLKEQGKIATEQEDDVVQELIGLTRLKLPTDTPIQDLLVTVDIVRYALTARDKDKAFEAVTVLLLQWIQTFNYSELAFQAFPFLEDTKEAILAEDFDEALTLLFMVLSKIRDMVKAQEKVNCLSRYRRE